MNSDDLCPSWNKFKVSTCLILCTYFVNCTKYYFISLKEYYACCPGKVKWNEKKLQEWMMWPDALWSLGRKWQFLPLWFFKTYIKLQCQHQLFKNKTQKCGQNSSNSRDNNWWSTNRLAPMANRFVGIRPEISEISYEKLLNNWENCSAIISKACYVQTNLAFLLNNLISIK